MGLKPQKSESEKCYETLFLYYNLSQNTLRSVGILWKVLIVDFVQSSCAIDKLLFLELTLGT